MKMYTGRFIANFQVRADNEAEAHTKLQGAIESVSAYLTVQDGANEIVPIVTKWAPWLKLATVLVTTILFIVGTGLFSKLVLGIPMERWHSLAHFIQGMTVVYLQNWASEKVYQRWLNGMVRKNLELASADPENASKLTQVQPYTPHPEIDGPFDGSAQTKEKT